MKSEIRKQRLAILARIDTLNVRQDAGEDVTAELEACGHELSDLTGKPKTVDTKKVTRALYDKAMSNGISRSTLSKRIYTNGWDPEEAATVPVLKRQKKIPVAEDPEVVSQRRALAEERAKWKKMAADNGIKWKTYRSRRYKGWSEEDAATIPPNTLGLSKEQLLAKENGISLDRYRSRIRRGWTEEEAATTKSTNQIKQIRRKREESK